MTIPQLEEALVGYLRFAMGSWMQFLIFELMVWGEAIPMVQNQ